MVIKLPKGVSNSAKLGATPGTVTTAVNNLTGANINPNMPKEPQLRRQSRSDIQKGLANILPSQPGKAAPAPSAMPPSPSVRQRPTVSQGLPMDTSRGYNIFSGMDANQISGMNQTMGLSNMTALPSLEINPLASRNLYAGQDQQQLFLMSGDGSDDDQEYAVTDQNQNGIPDHFEEPHASSFMVGTPADNAGGHSPSEPQYYSDLGAAPAQSIINDPAYDGSGMDQDELLKKAQEAIEKDATGIDPVQKQEMFDLLDQEYTSKLQFQLDNLDRQAAMMGTFGSGSHMRNVNNALAQSLTAMAEQYNEINKLDAELSDRDLQQEYDNYVKLAGAAGSSLMDKINIGMKVDEVLVTPIAEWLASQENIDPSLKEDLEQSLNEITMTLFQNLLADGVAWEQAIAIAAEQVKQMFNQFESSGDLWKFDEDGNPVDKDGNPMTWAQADEYYSNPENQP